MSSTSTISIFSLFLVLLSISSLDIVAAAPPGRHAPPYLAGKLGSHRRALKSWLGMKSPEPTQAYYGEEHGLVSNQRVPSLTQLRADTLIRVDRSSPFHSQV
jgi:hypothetical protein